MWHVQMAELRNSWSVWLGVSLGFIVINFSLALSALVLLAGVTAVQDGILEELQSAAFTYSPAINIALCAIVGAIVIGSSTSLVIDTRRGSLARLALSGLTPRQVIATIMIQLIIMSLVCSIIGDLLAYAVLGATINYLGLGSEDPLPAIPEAIYALWPVLLANLFSVGLALLGGYKQARHASRIPAVDALRQANGIEGERMTVGRWIKASLWMLLVILSFGTIPMLTSEPDKETVSSLVQGSVLLLVISGALLSQLAPLLVGPITRLWTSLIPSLGSAWDLSRVTTIAKAARLTKSVVPVMTTIGLLFGLVALGNTFQSLIYANGGTEQLSGTGIIGFLILLGLPLLISMTGAVGSLIMMSKQRDAELALSGIIGATPGQRLLMPVMEGIIIAVTGTILSLVMVAIAISYLAIGIPLAGYNFAFTPSYMTFIVAFIVSVIIIVAATLLPTLRALRKSEPQVIARLVAE